MKLKTQLPYDPEILILSVYEREMKTYVYIKARIQILITTLFTTVKTCTQTFSTGKEMICGKSTQWTNL